jgi:hypothetical protein
MRLDPRLVAVAHEAEAADGARDDELDRQDGVDLADELVADLDGRFGDGAAKLRTAVSSMDGMIRRVSLSLQIASRILVSSYLEVIGNVILAAAGAGEETLLVLGGAALGLVRRGRLRVSLWVLLRSRRVFDVGRHGC